MIRLSELVSDLAMRMDVKTLVNITVVDATAKQKLTIELFAASRSMTIRLESTEEGFIR